MRYWGPIFGYKSRKLRGWPRHLVPRFCSAHVSVVQREPLPRPYVAWAGYDLRVSQSYNTAQLLVALVILQQQLGELSQLQ